VLTRERPVGSTKLNAIARSHESSAESGRPTKRTMSSNDVSGRAACAASSSQALRSSATSSRGSMPNSWALSKPISVRSSTGTSSAQVLLDPHLSDYLPGDTLGLSAVATGVRFLPLTWPDRPTR
jgi:hypothetical protein